MGAQNSSGRRLVWVKLLQLLPSCWFGCPMMLWACRRTQHEAAALPKAVTRGLLCAHFCSLTEWLCTTDDSRSTSPASRFWSLPAASTCCTAVAALLAASVCCLVVDASRFCKPSLSACGANTRDRAHQTEHGAGLRPGYQLLASPTLFQAVTCKPTLTLSSFTSVPSRLFSAWNSLRFSRNCRSRSRHRHGRQDLNHGSPYHNSCRHMRS